MNKKAAGPSGMMSEMVKAAGGAKVDRITRPSNQTIGGVIPAEWELNTIVNCHKEKGDSLERGNYRGLKLTDQILKISERNIEKLIR